MKKFFLLFCLVAATVRLFAFTPVPYAEAVSFSFRIYGVGCGYLTVNGESGSPTVGFTINGSNESPTGMAWLRPGKAYDVSFSASGPGEYYLSFIGPSGYQIYIDDMPQDLLHRNGLGGEYTHYYRIRLIPAEGQNRVELSTFSGIDLGKSITWSVGLGGLRPGGRSCGQIVFKEMDLTNSPASRSRLYYAVPGSYGDITVYYDGASNQTLRQIRVPQGIVDLVDDAGGGYWLKFYQWSQATEQLLTFSGTPWKTIRVQAPSATELRITETEGSVSRVSKLTIDQGTVASGSFVWTLREGDGSNWIRTTRHTSSVGSTGVSVTGSGDTVTTSGSYRVHTFSGSGTLSFGGPMAVDMLLVGGGGGGSSGGGGGGGVVYASNVTLAAGTYAATVGQGGAGNGSFTGAASSGGSTTFAGYTALGGGGGGSSLGRDCLSGGSGGGAGRYWNSASAAGAAGTAGQGYAGGASPGNSTSLSPAGGGGGAGGVGFAGIASTNTSGAGGPGIANSITGASVYYGGGGGGGSTNAVTAGGGSIGGGGAGSSVSGIPGASGTNGLGGGGGGCFDSSPYGGTGGSGVVIVRYVPSTGTTYRDVVIEVRTGDLTGSIVSKTKVHYTTFAWGEEVTEAAADPTGTNLKTVYNYHTDSSKLGNYRQLSSVTGPTGGWVATDYYDDWGRRGNVRYEYRPFLNTPASVSRDSTTGVFTEYDYVADWTGRYTRLSLRQEKTNNELSAKTTITNGDIISDGHTWQRETIASYRYSSATSMVSDYVERCRGDAGWDDLYRPYLSRATNGAQTAWSRQMGTYNSSTKVFRTLDSNSHWRELVLHGSWQNSSGAERPTNSAGTYFEWDQDASNSQRQLFNLTYLTPNKSTMDATIYDRYGQIIRTESWVYTGSGAFSLMSAEDLSYDYAGRLLSRVRNGVTVETNTYANGRLQRTIDVAGVTTDFTYDAIGRVITATKRGAPAAAAVITSGYSYPAQGDITTTYTYDGVGHVVSQSTSGGGLTLATTRVYDLAGRLSSETVPGPFTTSFVYDLVNRLVTTTFPGGGTKVEQSYLDGRLWQIWGSAAITQYNGYWIDAGRLACQRVDGGVWDRKANLYWDWLGRQTEVWQTNWSGGYSGTLWSYNSMGQLVKLTQPGMADTLFSYDSHGQLSSQWLDVNGNGLLDAGGTDRITVQDWGYSYDGSGWFLNKGQSVYTQDGATTAKQVSKVGQKLAGMVANRISRTDTYDVYGNLAMSFTDVDPANKRVVAWTQLPGVTTTPQTISYNGLLVESRDQAGVVTRYEYDTLGRMTRSIDPRTGATVTAFKTGSSLVDRVIDPSGVVQASYTYDGAGRVATITDAFNKVQRFAYNERGQVTRQWGSAANPVESVYDSLGRVSTMKSYRGGTGWNGAAWPSDPGDADLTNWSYQPATGLLASKKDASCSATNRTVEYTYSNAGQLLTRKWARGITTTYSYSSTTGELLGTDYGDTTPDVTYTYNRIGQLATATDVTGTRTFAFNLAGTLELQSERLPTYFNSRWLTYGYATSGVVGRLTSFGVGTSSNGYADQRVDYGYYAADGRLDTITAVSAGSTSYTYKYEYQSNSHLVAKVSQTTVGYADLRVYDPQHAWVDSRTTTVGSATKAAFAYSQDIRGRTTAVTKTGEIFSRYGAGSPGVATSYGYNDRSELTSEVTKLNGTDTALLGRNDAYAYDNFGNRTSTNHNGYVSAYAPNNLNQYTSRTVPGIFDVSGAASEAATVTVNGVTAPRQGQYFYSVVGLNNASAAVSTSIAVSDGTTTASVAAYLPKATQDFGYDLDGNLTDDTRWTYTYDAENRLIAMETASAAIAAGVARQRFEFTNDYLGRRVQKLSKTWNGSSWVTALQERFLYRGWELAAVLNSSQTVVRSFFWGKDAAGATGSDSGAGGAGGLLMIQESGQSYLPAYDAMGSVHALIRAADGSVVAAYEYDAFGNVLRETGAYAASNPFRYATKYTDIETGQIYYGLRYYNPTLGRFNNRDPLEERGGLNLYAFGHNSPSRRWDVLGLSDSDENGGGSWLSNFWYALTGSGGSDGPSDGTRITQSNGTDTWTSTYHSDGPFGAAYYNDQMGEWAAWNSARMAKESVDSYANSLADQRDSFDNMNAGPDGGSGGFEGGAAPQVSQLPSTSNAPAPNSGAGFSAAVFPGTSGSDLIKDADVGQPKYLSAADRLAVYQKAFATVSTRRPDLVSAVSEYDGLEVRTNSIFRKGASVYPEGVYREKSGLLVLDFTINGNLSVEFVEAMVVHGFTHALQQISGSRLYNEYDAYKAQWQYEKQYHSTIMPVFGPYLDSSGNFLPETNFNTGHQARTGQAPSTPVKVAAPYIVR